MLRRLARLVLVGALAASTLAIVGGGVATAQTGPVGYTVGADFDGFADCEFFSVDVSTGELTQISDPSTEINCADGLTFAPDGTLYAYTNHQSTGGKVNAELVTIDLATGAQTVIGPLPNVFVNNGGMTFDAAGNLWLYVASFDPSSTVCATNDDEVCLFQVDPATAATQFVGTSDTAIVQGLTARCTPDEVLAIVTPNDINGVGSGTEIKRVDTATGALDLVVELPDTWLPRGLDFDSAGALWALAATPPAGIGFMEVEQVDLTTGDVTHVRLNLEGNDFEGFLAGLAISPVTCPAPPPEPAPEVVLEPTFTG